MTPREWCSIAAAPVFRWRDLVRIEATVALRSRETEGIPRGSRAGGDARSRLRLCRRLLRLSGFAGVSRRRLETLVGSTVPVSPEEYRLRYLPRLRVVLLIPRTPPPLEADRPIPVFALERLLRWDGAPRVTGRRTFDFPTPRGIDRYIVSPAGLVSCTPLPLEEPLHPPRRHPAAAPAARGGNGTTPLDRFRLRTVPLRVSRRRRVSVAPGEVVAIVIALAGIVIYGSTNVVIGKKTPAAVIATPIEATAPTLTETLESLSRVLPGASLVEVEREAEHFYLRLLETRETPGAEHALMALPAVERIRRNGGTYEIEGVAR